MNGVLAFWITFILTRPLGASLGDFMTKPLTEGGLGLGMTAVNVVFLGIIVILIAYLTIKKKRSRPPLAPFEMPVADEALDGGDEAGI
jgi:uncharacterized membrane-anchored protein